jgi:uncharacterized membrane protein
MHDINWWLTAASFLLGLLLTFAFTIRRVKREVPVSALAAAGGAAAAKSVGGHEPYGAGSARVGAGGSGPAGWTIKGNEKSMLYHTPDSPNYKRIVHDVWFRDEESAQLAGFTHWGKEHAKVDTAKLVGGAATAAGGAAAAKLAGGREPYGAGSARADAGGSGPAGWTIKGNEESMLYHTPDSPNYKRIVHDVWFRDEESARRAGFTHWGEGHATGPYGAGSAKAAADGSGPVGWTVKGNEDSMLYHTPDSPNYKQTIAEVWFRKEESAQRAGFTHWGKGRQN